MSEKKSPPHKDKASTSKPLQVESKPNKRKLTNITSPTEEDDKKNQQQQQQQQQKRKRPNMPEGSPEHMGIGSPRGAGTVSRLNVPLSERQQMAMLMRMQDESSVGDASPKSPSSGNQVTSTKRTPADKKVNKRNERGEAPLHMAAKKGDYKQTKRLLKAGASVNMKDYAGWTALHEACNSGNVRVARCLLKAGADVNVQGFEDDTPLHDASSNGHRKLVQLLLRHGANPMQPNMKGKTAINVAATPEIDAILRGNSVSYNSDLDSHSEASSSDSNLSMKEDERSNIDDGDFKPQSLPGKSEVLTSSGPASSISSSLGPTSSSVGSAGTLGVRRQSVPPSPEKMAASPRLYLKLQHKKSSSSSSSTTDEQQKVSEWNVLSMDTGCEVTSEGDPSSRSSFERPGSTTAARPAGSEDNWSRFVGQSSGPRPNRGGATDSDGFPDSTVAVSAPSSMPPNPLERTATEPFTPRGLEPLGNSDNEEEHSDVFSNSSSNNIKTSNTFNTPCSSIGTSNEIVKQQPLPPPSSSSQQQQPQQHPFQSLQQQHQQHLYQQQQQQHQSQQQHQPQQHIPGQTISTYHGVRHTLKLPNVVQTLPSSSLGPEQSGVSSSFPSSSSSSPSSSSHRASGSSCQFSLVSSSSSLPSLTTSSSSSVLGPSLPSHHPPHPPHHPQSGPTVSAPSSTSHVASESKPGAPVHSSIPFGSYPSRGPKGGGSIVTGLSDRAMAASGGAVSSNSSIPTSTPAPPHHLQWEPGRLPAISRLEEKSDTSSCDSPLRVDMEDSNPVPSDQGSRPSSPKVPPLKIIMPPKVGGPSTNISKPQAKPALPYVLNPTTESESWDGVEEGGQRTMPTSSLTTTQERADYSQSPLPRPLSRAGSGVGVSSSEMTPKPSDLSGPLPRNLDVEEGASRESDSRTDQADGSGEKTEDGREKRPTRTLRSHTAMMQQAQQQQKDKVSDKDKNGATDSKDEGDNSSTTRSQKGDDLATDDSSFPPRKRKLRNKTEQQTMQISATVPPPVKINQPLEKPPNPYETYLNLRRQIASRHRSLCNIAPKPPTGFKDFLMVNCTYVLQGNATSTLSVPMLPPPNLVTEPMREFFIQQEKERYRLRLQHVIEREKLMLSIEQEILREHARAARAMANQTLPFSVCTILREEEIYNQQEVEQVEDRDKNVRSRYNGRQFLSWLQDVDDKYEKIKQLLLLRHHHEAESLYAVQKLDWEWKLKECGLCDHKNTPVIDDLHVPMVTVSDEFELLPSS